MLPINKLKVEVLPLDKVKVEVQRLDEDIVKNYLQKKAEQTNMEDYESDSSQKTVRYESSNEDEKNTKYMNLRSKIIRSRRELHAIKGVPLKKKKALVKNTQSTVYKLLKTYTSKNTLPESAFMANNKPEYTLLDRPKDSWKSSKQRSEYFRKLYLDDKDPVIPENSNSDLKVNFAKDSNEVEIKYENLNLASENVGLNKESSNSLPAQSEDSIKIVNAYSINPKDYQKGVANDSSMNAEENISNDNMRMKTISDAMEVDIKMETNEVEINADISHSYEKNTIDNGTPISADDVHIQSANCQMDLQEADIPLASTSFKNSRKASKFEKVKSPCLECKQLKKNYEYIINSMHEDYIKKKQCLNAELNFERTKTNLIVQYQLNQVQKLVNMTNQENISPDDLKSNIKQLKDSLSEISNLVQSSCQRTHDTNVKSETVTNRSVNNSFKELLINQENSSPHPNKSELLQILNQPMNLQTEPLSSQHSHLSSPHSLPLNRELNQQTISQPEIDSEPFTLNPQSNRKSQTNFQYCTPSLITTNGFNYPESTHSQDLYSLSNSIQTNYKDFVPAAQNQSFVGTGQNYAQSKATQVQLSSATLQENFPKETEIKKEPNVANSEMLLHNTNYSQTQPCEVSSSVPSKSSLMEQNFLNKPQVSVTNQQSFQNINFPELNQKQALQSATSFKHPKSTSEDLFKQNYLGVSSKPETSQQQLYAQPILQNTTANREMYLPNLNQNLSNTLSVSLTSQQDINYPQSDLQKEINKILTGQNVSCSPLTASYQPNQQSPMIENETQLLASLPQLSFVHYTPTGVAATVPSLLFSPSCSSTETAKTWPSVGNVQVTAENETKLTYPQSQPYLSVINTCNVNLQ